MNITMRRADLISKCSSLIQQLETLNEEYESRAEAARKESAKRSAAIEHNSRWMVSCGFSDPVPVPNQTIVMYPPIDYQETITWLEILLLLAEVHCEEKIVVESTYAHFLTRAISATRFDK